MNKTSLPRLLLAGLLAPWGLSAEPVTISTVPFGGMILEIPAGTSVVSDVFIGSALYQGPVASVSAEGDVLGMSNVPAIENPSYIHVLSGDDEGMVSTILEADSESVTVETPLNLVEGDIVAIRKHQTIGQFFAGAALSDFDTVTFYNTDGKVETLLYFEGNWYDSETEAPSDNTIIFPAEAIVPSLSAGTTLVVSGSVSANPVKVEFGANVVNLIGGLDPVNSPTLNSIFLSALNDFETVTLYNNVNGTLTSTGTYLRFGDSLFDAFTEDPADDVSVEIASGAVILTSNKGYLHIGAAYSSSNE
ncbi:MAG: hypothetical protein JJU00_03780 [Opitutales bacterium]|nr:hypothetical protein [Opitutales bacterium]